jgi:hypothetical protein
VSCVVEGLLADGMLSILAGKDKLGKTLLALEIGRCVLRGTPLFGLLPVRQGLVMAALLDDPLVLTLERLDELGMRGPSDDLHIVNPANFENPFQFLQRLEDEALALRPALIIIDALYLFVPDSRDAGNDAARMRPIMLRLDRLGVRTGTAVLVVAHDTKSGTDVAGSYVVRAMAKVIMRLTAGARGTTVEAQETSTGHRVLTVQSKLGEAVDYQLELRGVGDWRLVDDFGGTVNVVDLRTVVLAHLDAGNDGSATEIARAVRRRRADVQAILGQLVAEGRVTLVARPHAGRGRAAAIYQVTTDSRPDAVCENLPAETPDGNSDAEPVESSHVPASVDFPSQCPGPRERGQDRNSDERGGGTVSGLDQGDPNA